MKVAKLFILIGSVLAIFPQTPPAAALLTGTLIALFLGNPWPTKNYTSKLLTWSVIGLGAGMNLQTVAHVGLHGIGYTIISIGAVLTVGYLLQKIFCVEEESALLITVGTAICGGSAIAAVTPVIRAKPHSVSVALGTVFLLNAIALLIFPIIGHHFHMTEHAFGLWSALAIHDTSSVVGATVSYGKTAAEVGTTVKLARALWIVPVALGIGLLKKNTHSSEAAGKAKKPWFILGFLLVAALVTWIPYLQQPGHWVEFAAKRMLVLTLFFIGLGLSKDTLKKVGTRPLLLGIVLWMAISIGTFLFIEAGIIS